jgi:pimeloyl-ACP methyl ester carboxylesterase
VMAKHWSEARCFEAMAESLEKLPVSVRQLHEGLSLGDLPVIVLSAGSAGAIAVKEHQHDAQLSTRGERVVVPDAGHWLQLDAPDAVVDAVRRMVAAIRQPDGS